MRKFYYLLSVALLAFAGTATASADAAEGWGNGKGIASVGEALTDVNQITDGGYYLMRNVGRATFLYERNDNKLWLQKPSSLSSTPTATQISEAFSGVNPFYSDNRFLGTNVGYVVKFIKISEGEDAGKYNIQMASGNYIPALDRGGRGKSTSATPEAYQVGKFATGTSNFYFVGTTPVNGNTVWMNGNGEAVGTPGSWCGWDPADATSSGDNSNAAYQLFPVTLSDYATSPGTTLTKSLDNLTSGYYEIINFNTGIQKRYIGSASISTNQKGEHEGEGTAIERETDADGSVLTKLWSFEKNAETGKYLIRNANTSCAVGQIPDTDGGAINMLATGTDESWAGAYEIAQGVKGDGTWYLKDGDKLMNAYGGDAKKIIAQWKNDASTTDNGSHWQFLEVTAVPLTIYADTQWASVTYPFAAQLPAELTAYIATGSTDSDVTLTAIGQTIPAKTPVFITLTDGTVSANTVYAVNIVSNDAAAPANNLLQGATAKRAGFDASSLYVLTSNGSNGAALKLNGTVTAIPANKAYLPTTSAAAAQTLALSFGDATGIGAVKTPAAEAGNDTYYDLQGRRVLYPAHGIFVKANGQKVYIK